MRVRLRPAGGGPLVVARVPDDHDWNALVLTARQRLGHGDSGGASFYLEDGAEIFSLDDLEDNDVLNVCFDEDGASCIAAPSSSTAPTITRPPPPPLSPLPPPPPRWPPPKPPSPAAPLPTPPPPSKPPPSSPSPSSPPPPSPLPTPPPLTPPAPPASHGGVLALILLAAALLCVVRYRHRRLRALRPSFEWRGDPHAASDAAADENPRFPNPFPLSVEINPTPHEDAVLAPPQCLAALIAISTAIGGHAHGEYGKVRASDAVEFDHERVL